MVFLIKYHVMIRVGVLCSVHLGKIHLSLLESYERYELVGFYDPDQKTKTLVKEKGYSTFKRIRFDPIM